MKQLLYLYYDARYCLCFRYRAALAQIVYYDGQFNDARLGVTLALTAALAGATVLNHAEVTRLLKAGAGGLPFSWASSCLPHSGLAPEKGTVGGDWGLGLSAVLNHAEVTRLLKAGAGALPSCQTHPEEGGRGCGLCCTAPELHACLRQVQGPCLNFLFAPFLFRS